MGKDGNVCTSAGVSVGRDLALAFIVEIEGKTAGMAQQGAEYYPSGKSYGELHKRPQSPQYAKKRT